MEEVFVAAYAALTQRARGCEAELRILATQPAHGVTGVTSFVLLADIGDQCLRTRILTLRAAISASSASTTTRPVFP
jgi:hypothetical protein